jgi:hypothetical protein
MPGIRIQLQKTVESRAPLAATRVVTEAGHFVVLTLIPGNAARLRGRGRQPLWETRVYFSEPPPRIGLGSRPHYVVLDAARDEAAARHELLVGRLEHGSLEPGTSRDILCALRPFLDRAAEAFAAGDAPGALAALDDALRVAGELDGVHSFLHRYVEIYLMRGLALEEIDLPRATAAYRQLIALYADYPSHHPETLRGVARAREAVERLTPVPHGHGIPSAVVTAEETADGTK